jgi:peroxiredoxin
MTLRDRLEARLAQAVAGRAPDVAAAYAEGLERVRAAGIAEHALGVGEAAPDFTLPDATGRPVGMRDLIAHGPLIICFYRGGWCPYCDLELRTYEELLPACVAAGVGVVAIGPEVPDVALRTAEERSFTFPLLADVGNVVARAFRLVHDLTPEVRAIYARQGFDLPTRTAQPPDGLTLPLPATYVVDGRGIVRFAFVAADYSERAEPADVLAVARGL